MQQPLLWLLLVSGFDDAMLFSVRSCVAHGLLSHENSVCNLCCSHSFAQHSLYDVRTFVAVSTTLVCTMLEASLKEDLERRTQQLLEERKAEEKEADKARLQTRLVEERRKAKKTIMLKQFDAHVEKYFDVWEAHVRYH